MKKVATFDQADLERMAAQCQNFAASCSTPESRMEFERMAEDYRLKAQACLTAPKTK